MFLLYRSKLYKTKYFSNIKYFSNYAFNIICFCFQIIQNASHLHQSWKPDVTYKIKTLIRVQIHSARV